MDVRIVPAAFEAPYTCAGCKGHPQDTPFADIGLFGESTQLREHVYLCEVCAMDVAAAFGHVRPLAYQETLEELEAAKALVAELTERAETAEAAAEDAVSDAAKSLLISVKAKFREAEDVTEAREELAKVKAELAEAKAAKPAAKPAAARKPAAKPAATKAP